MGKPSRTQKNRRAGVNGQGAVDLASVKAAGDPEKVAEAIRVAELENGMRCGGCHRRIRVGFRFTKFSVQVVEGAAVIAREVANACSRDDCAYGDHVSSAQPQVVEPIEYAWLDGLPDDDGYYAADPEEGDEPASADPDSAAVE